MNELHAGCTCTLTVLYLSLYFQNMNCGLIIWPTLYADNLCPLHPYVITGFANVSPHSFRKVENWDVFLSFSGFCLALRSTDQPGLSLYICLEVNGLGYFTQNETLVLCFYSPGH